MLTAIDTLKKLLPEIPIEPPEGWNRSPKAFIMRAIRHLSVARTHAYMEPAPIMMRSAHHVRRKWKCEEHYLKLRTSKCFIKL